MHILKVGMNVFNRTRHKFCVVTVEFSKALCNTYSMLKQKGAIIYGYPKDTNFRGNTKKSKTTN